MFLSFAFAFATDNPRLKPNTNEITHATDNEKSDRYVIVYKVNGVEHAVIINRYVCCICLAMFHIVVDTGIEIIDCGPVGMVNVPSGSVFVEEETALDHFGLTDWPEEEE
jgi:hypothetical protein